LQRQQRPGIGLLGQLIFQIHFFTFQIKSIMNNTTSPAKSLTIVELEERFETTAAAADAGRCSGNTVEV
jgi:hypothetical protein